MTVNGEIPCRTVESCCFVRDGIPYLEVIHDHVSLDDLDGISFQGVGGNIVQSEKISGNWEILFQVENMSVRELELTGAAAGSTISTQLILTPLGAMITGEYEKGYWGGQSCAVVYQDGTRMDHTEIEAGQDEPGRGLYSGELDLWGGCGSGPRGGAGDRRSLDSPNRSGRWCSAGRLEQTGTWTCFVQVPGFLCFGPDQIRFHTAPPGTSVTSMPRAFSSSRMRSASGKSLAFLASPRAFTRASISGPPRR